MNQDVKPTSKNKPATPVAKGKKEEEDSDDDDSDDDSEDEEEVWCGIQSTKVVSLFSRKSISLS